MCFFNKKLFYFNTNMHFPIFLHLKFLVNELKKNQKFIKLACRFDCIVPLMM